MIKKRAGRPGVVPSHLDSTGMDLEQRRPVLYKLVRYADLAAGAMSFLDMALGVYGRTRYGRSKYGARRGIYGSDRYGSARYN